VINLFEIAPFGDKMYLICNIGVFFIADVDKGGVLIAIDTELIDNFNEIISGNIFIFHI
jgi:hypothetical protein